MKSLLTYLYSTHPSQLTYIISISNLNSTSMKTLQYILVFFVVCSIQTSAQFTMSVGPYIMPKYGINISERPYITTNPNQYPYTFMTAPTENDASFDIDFGLSGRIHLKDLKLSAIFDGGYSSTSSILKYVDDTDDEYTFITRVNYVNIASMYNSGWFLIGVNFGIPISGTTKNLSETTEIEARPEDMRTKIEFRLGGIIPIMKHSTGSMNVVFLGNFMFTGLYGDNLYDNSKYSIIQHDNLTNPRVWTFSLGVNYLFTILDR
ncbi:MAG: hypothetical protein IPM69_10720 [Ignavibacteria bacterium]|nr:hypothetical protein [Ignavibacteria bacterium]